MKIYLGIIIFGIILVGFSSSNVYASSESRVLGDYNITSQGLAVIDNQSYFVSNPYYPDNSNKTVTFHNVVFKLSFGTPDNPGNFQRTAVMFPDGFTDTLAVAISYPTETALSHHFNPKAGFSVQQNGTLRLLVSNSAPVQFLNPPLIINQVELDSPFVLFPDNQTCSSEHGFDNPHSCLTNLIPGKKVQCSYFIGSNGCEPIHEYTSGASKACLDLNETTHAPQWLEIYNTQNKTLQVQLLQVQSFQNLKPWGEDSYVSIPITLDPYEKCTYGFGPADEPLTLDQTNMSFTVSYDYAGQNYIATTPPLTDRANDSSTWQLFVNKWVFAEQNTVPVPEFPYAVPVFAIGIFSLIVFYRIKFWND